MKKKKTFQFVRGTMCVICENIATIGVLDKNRRTEKQ